MKRPPTDHEEWNEEQEKDARNTHPPFPHTEPAQEPLDRNERKSNKSVKEWRDELNYGE